MHSIRDRISDCQPAQCFASQVVYVVGEPPWVYCRVHIVSAAPWSALLPAVGRAVLGTLGSRDGMHEAARETGTTVDVESLL